MNEDLKKGMYEELDAFTQIEYNKQKNVDQDNQLKVISSQLDELIKRAPAGFLPKVYYGLNSGYQKYRFTLNADINIQATGEIGDAFEFYTTEETEEYIPAVGFKKDENTVNIILQGDYNNDVKNFNIINMRTGSADIATLNDAVSLQIASSLKDLDAQKNKEKQVTVLKDLETGRNNVVFASIDINKDNKYNWISTGAYTNGKDGYSIFVVTDDKISETLKTVKIGDILLATESFAYDEVSFEKGDICDVLTVYPLTVSKRGNVKGDQGIQGIQGEQGPAGADGHSPYIKDGNWYIKGNDTGVQALGVNGTPGEDGKAFAMQQDLYSTPENYGKPNNVDFQGNPLKLLPTLPQSDISGKGYAVYDPLTTPLKPYYDLYYANDGDTQWTIIHPWSGLNGKDGKDGKTPYIQDNNWYINGNNTGVPATGPQGPQGPAGSGSTDILFDEKVDVPLTFNTSGGEFSNYAECKLPINISYETFKQYKVITLEMTMGPKSGYFVAPLNTNSLNYVKFNAVSYLTAYTLIAIEFTGLNELTIRLNRIPSSKINKLRIIGIR